MKSVLGRSIIVNFPRTIIISYWLLLVPSDVSVSLQNPRFDIDLLVTADIATFYQVWLGRMSFAESLEKKRVQLDGVQSLVRAFPTWFAWSPAAKAVRTAAGRVSSLEV